MRWRRTFHLKQRTSYCQPFRPRVGFPRRKRTAERIRLGEARRERENKPSVELSDRSAVCSAGSSVLLPGQTPLRRTRPPYGSAPSRTALDQIERLQRSPGSRACCFSTCSGSPTTQGQGPTRDLTRTPVRPSLFANKVGTLKWIFRSSIARPADTSVYASNVTSRRRPQDSRPRWFATPSL